LLDFGAARDDRRARAHRKGERKLAAASRRAFQADASALQLDEFLHQREAEAGAAELAARGAVNLAELLENQVVMFRLDADPFVAHGDRDPAILLVRPVEA